MKFLHKESNTTYEIGRLFDTDGRTFDINVITKWDEENDFEQSPVLVDYYFGDAEDDATNYYIDEFLKKQRYLKNAVNVLECRIAIDGEFMEPTEIEELNNTINCLKEMIVNF